MKLISFKDLAKLRLPDFVEDDADIWIEESGMEGTLGLGGFERLGETAFEWRQDEHNQTAAVTLDLGEDSEIPLEAAVQIIAKLGLPIRKGMHATELLEIFGTPHLDKKTGSHRFLRFVCGATEFYLLGCGVDDEDGLTDFFLVRKDYCEDDDAI